MRRPLFAFIPVSLLLIAALFLPTLHGHGQNLIGEVIQVSKDVVVNIVFDEKIDKVRFGDEGRSFAFEASGSGGKSMMLLKVKSDDPSSTNMFVEEGGRSHIFNIQFLPGNVDLLQLKLYYDYSNLSALRKRAKELEARNAALPAQQGSPPVARNDAPQSPANPTGANQKKKSRSRIEEPADEPVAKADPPRNDEPKRRNQEVAARKKSDDDAAKQLAADNAARKKADDDQAKKQAADDAARKKSDDLAKKKAVDDARKAEIDRQKDADDARREQERQSRIAARAGQQRKADSTAAAQEYARRRKATADSATTAARLAAKAQADRNTQAAARQQAALARQQRAQDSLDNAATLASAAEAKRLRAEASQIAAQRRKDSIASVKAEASARKTAAASAAKARQDSIAAARTYARAHDLDAGPDGYTHRQLYLKYPEFSFGDPPVGQYLTGEAYIATDTLRNFEAAREAMTQDRRLSIASNDDDSVHYTITNVYEAAGKAVFVVEIDNESSRDMLTGVMHVGWKQHSDGKLLNLYPAYVSAYPPMPPHTKATIAYCSPIPNCAAKDEFTFTIKDRTGHRELTARLSGKTILKAMQP